MQTNSQNTRKSIQREISTYTVFSYLTQLSDPRVIQMTSPNLNYFIIGGALLMFTAVYVGVMPGTDETRAHVQCIVSNGALRQNTYYIHTVTGKCAREHRPQQALPTSAFVPSARPFVSVVVGPLQVWSHHGRATSPFVSVRVVGLLQVWSHHRHATRPFVSVVVLLQVWSHHRHWRTGGGRCGYRHEQCPSGPMFACAFSCVHATPVWAQRIPISLWAWFYV